MRTLAVAALVWLLAACNSLDLSPINPQGMDLSGEWVVDFSESDVVPDLREGFRGGKRKVRPRRQQREDLQSARGSGLAFVVHDFQVLGADKLEIEQNRDSMGIRYHPGVYRDLSWGERERGLWEIHAGWEANDLVIVSRANEMLVTERMVLDGDRLAIKVTVVADGDEKTYHRVYRRRR